MSISPVLAPLAALLAFAACTDVSPPAPKASIAPSVEPVATAPVPPPVRPQESAARPNVRMAADPPPPYTYWAPAGSTIRNHGNPGLWIAEVDGRQVATYFGDDCGAAKRQGWIGLSRKALPAAPTGAQWRVFEEGEPVNQDLRPNRLNIVIDPKTQTVIRVFCV